MAKRLFPNTKILMPCYQQELRNTIKYHPEMLHDMDFCKKHDF